MKKSKDQKRLEAETRQETYDKLTLLERHAKALRHGHPRTRETKRLVELLKQESSRK